MAKNRFSERFQGGNSPSSDRQKDVSQKIQEVKEEEAAIEINEHQEEVSKKRAELQKESEKIFKKRATKAHTSQNLQSDLSKLLNMASTEFEVSQKELLAIAVDRLLKDLKKSSKILQAYY